MLSCNEHCANYHAFKETESDSAFQNKTLREKCLYSELFWSYFPAFGLNTDQNTDTFHVLRSQNEASIGMVKLSNNVKRYTFDNFYQFAKSQNGKCILHDTAGISYCLVSLEKCDKSN